MEDVGAFHWPIALWLFRLSKDRLSKMYIHALNGLREDKYYFTSNYKKKIESTRSHCPLDLHWGRFLEDILQLDVIPTLGEWP